MKKTTLIKGDGIGPEITDAVVKIIDAAGVKIDWDVQTAGADVIETEGSPLPDRVIESVKRNKIALKSPVTTPIVKGFRSVNVQLRKELDLYANLRPCYNLPNVKTRYDGVNIVVVRENTEDLYAGIERQVDENTAESIKIITRSASKYPQIKFREILVDNCCMQLVQNPNQFDVLLLPNLYGDIVSDLCAGLIGGLGIAQGANIGKDYAVFEPVHGSAPDIAGQDKANPTAMLMSAIEMLNYIGETEAASRIKKALFETLEAGVKTIDIGGKSTCSEFTNAIIARL